MDSSIWAALIGGCTTLPAAVITTVYSRHRESGNQGLGTTTSRPSAEHTMNDTLLAVLMIVGGLSLTLGGVVVLVRRQSEPHVTAEASPIAVPTPVPIRAESGARGSGKEECQ